LNDIQQEEEKHSQEQEQEDTGWTSMLKRKTTVLYGSVSTSVDGAYSSASQNTYVQKATSGVSGAAKKVA